VQNALLEITYFVHDLKSHNRRRQVLKFLKHRQLLHIASFFILPNTTGNSCSHTSIKCPHFLSNAWHKSNWIYNKRKEKHKWISGCFRGLRI